jgi:hypothetical protein
MSRIRPSAAPVDEHDEGQEDGKAVREEPPPWPERTLLMAGQGTAATSQQRAAVPAALSPTPRPASPDDAAGQGPPIVRNEPRTDLPAAPPGVRLLPPVLRYRPPAAPPLWSANATWRHLATHQPVAEVARPVRGWTSRWTVTYRHGQVEHTETVGDVPVADLLSSDPIRVNTWHGRTTTRSGLHFLASAGRLQAHESLFERDLLILLDFDGVSTVASQPFRLVWHDGERQRRHTPDFMIVADGIPTVVNCRPAPLVTESLLENCAAVAEVCVARGWAHTLVTDYPRPPFTVISTVAATRNCDDPFGYGEDLVERLASDGPAPFARLATDFAAPAIARAVLQRLIWDREVSVDLSRLLADDTLVALPGQEPSQ